MKLNSKHVISLSTALLSLSLMAPAYATSYTQDGHVSRLTVMSSSQTYDDSFVLSGVTSLGTCGTNADGNVVFVIKKETSTDPTGNRQFAMAQSAINLDYSLEVVVNDSSKDARGFCYVAYMSELVPA